jgi:pyrroloquinoline quinone biosynthesis protein B
MRATNGLAATVLLLLVIAPASAIERRQGASATPAEAPRGPIVRVLGTAQDGGFPHAACACDRCRRARSDSATARRIASLAVVLPQSERVFLIDATPDVRAQLTTLSDLRPPPTDRVDRQPVDGILLTHAHIGHYLGLAFFGYEAIHSRDLPVIATPRMAEYLRTNGPWSQLVAFDNISLQELSPGRDLALGEQVTVTAVRAPHRDEYADTVGFLIAGPRRSLFYLPDTDSWHAWTPPVTEILDRVDIALLDGTFFSAAELPGRRVEEIGHPLIERSMDLLQSRVDADDLEVYFTHLNHSNPALDRDGETRRLIESRGFHVLDDGQQFPF